RRHTRFSRDWSSDVCSSDLTYFAPLISLSFNKGEDNEFLTASIARSSPSAVADPMIATPLFFMTVLTSLKSTFINPVTEISSARSEERRVGRGSRCDGAEHS